MQEFGYGRLAACGAVSEHSVNMQYDFTRCCNNNASLKGHFVILGIVVT